MANTPQYSELLAAWLDAVTHSVHANTLLNPPQPNDPPAQQKAYQDRIKVLLFTPADDQQWRNAVACLSNLQKVAIYAVASIWEGTMLRNGQPQGGIYSNGCPDDKLLPAIAKVQFV